MRFQSETGQLYQLDFKRQQFETVRYNELVDGKLVEKTGQVKARRPDTTAILFTVDPTTGKAIERIAEATVKVADVDQFTKEDGRLYALKALTEVLKFHFMGARQTYLAIVKPLWKAYTNRFSKEK